MDYKVTAKQYGNSFVFVISAASDEEAYQKAHAKANSIFGFHGDSSDAGAPKVSVVPIVEEEPKQS